MFSMLETLGAIPRTTEKQLWWWIPEVPVLQEVRQEDPKFEVILVYMASWSPAWAT